MYPIYRKLKNGHPEFHKVVSDKRVVSVFNNAISARILVTENPMHMQDVLGDDLSEPCTEDEFCTVYGQAMGLILVSNT